MNFQFQNPWFLLLFVLWILVLYLYNGQKKFRVFVYSDISQFRNIPQGWVSRLKPLVNFLINLGIACLIIALARPQQGREDYRVRTEGIAISVCLDRSGSMQAMDFFIDKKRVDRLEIVKKVFRDFIVGNKDFPGRPDDLVSLVAFGGFVDTICPLTLDHETLAQMLDMIKTPKPLIDRRGNPIRSDILDQESATAIGDALMTAIDRLKTTKSKSRVIILLSDGVQNVGVATAQEAAKIASDHGIKIYTIGIGTNKPVPFPVYGPSGTIQGYSQELLQLDATTLKEVADKTSGLYFHVEDTNGLKKVCEEIDKLERTTFEDRVYTRYNELYRYFLLPGLLMLCTGLILVFTRFRRMP